MIMMMTIMTATKIIKIRTNHFTKQERVKKETQ